MKAELLSITPAFAELLLKSNTANRHVTESHVAYLVKEIKAGRWKVNGDTIRISKSGLIIDGQHRLLAIVRAGVTIESWVVTGLPDDVFDTIDVGKRRSPGDTLECRGEQNAHRLAAALALIDKYMTGRVDKSSHYTNSETEALLAKYPTARESLITSKSGKGLLLPSVLDACHYLFTQKDPVMTEVFMDRILKGVGLEEGDPWYVLRERLLTNSISNTKLSKAHVMALCIKAWNHARAGRRITKLQLNGVDGKIGVFPVLQ